MLLCVPQHAVNVLMIAGGRTETDSDYIATTQLQISTGISITVRPVTMAWYPGRLAGAAARQPLRQTRDANSNLKDSGDASLGDGQLDPWECSGASVKRSIHGVRRHRGHQADDMGAHTYPG